MQDHSSNEGNSADAVGMLEQTCEKSELHLALY